MRVCSLMAMLVAACAPAPGGDTAVDLGIDFGDPGSDAEPQPELTLPQTRYLLTTAWFPDEADALDIDGDGTPDNAFLQIIPLLSAYMGFEGSVEGFNALMQDRIDAGEWNIGIEAVAQGGTLEIKAIPGSGGQAFFQPYGHSVNSDGTARWYMRGGAVEKFHTDPVDTEMWIGYFAGPTLWLPALDHFAVGTVNETGIDGMIGAKFPIGDMMDHVVAPAVDPAFHGVVQDILMSVADTQGDGAPAITASMGFSAVPADW